MPAAATARLKAFCRLLSVSGPIGPPGWTPRLVAGNSHGRERCVVLLQNPVRFLPAQDDGQLLLRTWPDKPQRGPVALECSLIEKLDPAQSDRRGRPRDLPIVGQIQEILSQLFFCQLSRRAVEMRKQLPDRAHVGLLRL